MPLPQIPRFNPWGEWRPFIFRGPLEEFHRLRNSASGLPPAAQAVRYYIATTKYEGIEFVLESNHLDSAPYRELDRGAVTVSCDHLYPTGDSQNHLRKPRYYYDSWLPLPGDSDDDIIRGLSLIDGLAATMGYVFHARVRAIIKYREYGHPGKPPIPEVTDADAEAFDQMMVRIRKLPPQMEAAVLQGIYWLQSSISQSDTVMAFLNAYFGYEGLCLALWNNASEIGLPLKGEYISAPKRKRLEIRREKIKKILQTTDDVEEAVKQAYFEVVSPIQRRLKTVNNAVFGTEKSPNTWLFDKNITEPGPAALRNIVHGRFAGLNRDLEILLLKHTDRLVNLLRHLITRTSRKLWQGAPLSMGQKQFSIQISPTDSFMCASGGISVKGNFKISESFLYSKGLL